MSPFAARPDLIGKYRRGDGLEALIGMELAIADQQDPDHCAVCGWHLGHWYYGFPFPLCPACNAISRRPVRLQCPWPSPRPCQRQECRKPT
jgi:hypothetical protein